MRELPPMHAVLDGMRLLIVNDCTPLDPAVDYRRKQDSLRAATHAAACHGRGLARNGIADLVRRMTAATVCPTHLRRADALPRPPRPDHDAFAAEALIAAMGV